MNLTTKQIAEEINGTIDGDSEIKISQLSKIEEGKKGSISFLANPKYTDYIYSTKASAVVVSNDFNPSEKISTTLIRVKDPYESFTNLLELYNSNKTESKGIGKTDFDFSIYKIAKSHEKLQCFFRLRRVVYENKDEGEIENWNIADGYLLIEKGVVNIDGNRSRWRMGGLSYDPSYLEDEVNLRLTKDGYFVGKMAYFTHHINTGEVPRSPLYIELKKHKKSKTLNYKSFEKESAELWIDVEEWAGGVMFVSNCKKK